MLGYKLFTPQNTRAVIKSQDSTAEQFANKAEGFPESPSDADNAEAFFGKVDRFLSRVESVASLGSSDMMMRRKNQTGSRSSAFWSPSRRALRVVSSPCISSSVSSAMPGRGDRICFAVTGRIASPLRGPSLRASLASLRSRQTRLPSALPNCRALHGLTTQASFRSFSSLLPDTKNPPQGGCSLL